MADSEVGALTALTGANVANDDKLLVDDTSAGPLSKRIDASELATYVLGKTDALTALTAANVAVGDKVSIVDVSVPEAKTITVAELLTFMQANGAPRVKRVNSQHSISSTTATEVTDLQFTLEAGTYIFQYNIIARSATATVSPMFGVNFTGTAAVRKMKIRAAGTGTTAITGVADDVGATSGQIEESVTVTAFSTTAPNMGFTGGVATTAADILYIIEGILIVTAGGDLELWHGSETATATSVEVGTSSFVVRTA